MGRKKTNEKKTKGKLVYLLHSFEEGQLRQSEIMIEEIVDGMAYSSRYDFYGFIPQSLLAEEVFLYQCREGNGRLFQKLTSLNGSYQIETRTRKKVIS